LLPPGTLRCQNTDPKLLGHLQDLGQVRRHQRSLRLASPQFRTLNWGARFPALITALGRHLLSSLR
jgi:hypothetical protein